MLRTAAVPAIAMLLTACASGAIDVGGVRPPAAATPADTAAHPPLWAQHPGLSGTSTVAQYDVQAPTRALAFEEI
jgi:hypothetical protein